MRFSAWLAASKLTLLSGSSTASRTTDSEYLSWVSALFHGENWKRSTRVFNCRSALAYRILGRNHGGTLAFFLQKSVGFPLENNLAFHGLARSRFLPEFAQAFLHRFTHQEIPEKGSS